MRKWFHYPSVGDCRPRLFKDPESDSEPLSPTRLAFAATGDSPSASATLRELKQRIALLEQQCWDGPKAPTAAAPSVRVTIPCEGASQSASRVVALQDSVPRTLGAYLPDTNDSLILASMDLLLQEDNPPSPEQFFNLRLRQWAMDNQQPALVAMLDKHAVMLKRLKTLAPEQQGKVLTKFICEQAAKDSDMARFLSLIAKEEPRSERRSTPTAPSRTSTQERNCFICQAKGHLQRDCPMRSNAPPPFQNRQSHH